MGTYPKETVRGSIYLNIDIAAKRCTGISGAIGIIRPV